MALAIKHIHDRKILHRDLKTQNIFMTSSGEIKIGDFGIARVLQHTYDCAQTAIGTPYYLSPEICQEKPYNQKSDIWSLGCILYEMVTLRHAFDANSMKGLVLKILRGSYPQIPSTYSQNLRDLIADMLIKNPVERPSIRKVLEKDFLAARISQLLSNTIAKHEFSNTFLTKHVKPFGNEGGSRAKAIEPEKSYRKDSKSSREEAKLTPAASNSDIGNEEEGIKRRPMSVHKTENKAMKKKKGEDENDNTDLSSNLDASEIKEKMPALKEKEYFKHGEKGKPLEENKQRNKMSDEQKYNNFL